MDVKQVTKWVEYQIEEVINKDLKEKITDEKTSFDVDHYVDDLIDKYFNSKTLQNLKENLNIDFCDSLNFISENSTDEKNTSHDSLDFESNGCQTFSTQELIKYLKSDSKEFRKKSLQALENSVEDLINQSSWNKLKEILQKILNNEESEEINNLVLKVFQKLLMQPKKPQILCKGFINIADILANQINCYNLKEYENASFEKVYDIKEGRWYFEKKPSDLENLNLSLFKNQEYSKAQTLIKLMWLLIDCQEQVPIKWIRFNEARFREIIFSFIHLLSSTTVSEDAKLSGLQLLSVLSPKANWCHYWCHTATGRSLLNSALRKYKHFFVQIVEVILNHMKTKKANNLPPINDGRSLHESAWKFENSIREKLKTFKNLNQTEREKIRPDVSLLDRCNCIRSAPGELKKSKPMKQARQKKSNSTSSEWIIKYIPQEIVDEAVFFHSISFISCLIQYRSGRALFPVQMATRKRLLSVQDLSLSVIEYLENKDNSEGRNANFKFTTVYRAKVVEILDILKKISSQINSTRMSAERYKFSKF